MGKTSNGRGKSEFAGVPAANGYEKKKSIKINGVWYVIRHRFCILCKIFRILL